ncbi:MAG: helix-turn-helix domain-containing protein [Galactobacter sp.]
MGTQPLKPAPTDETALDTVAVGRRIRALRKAAGMTLDALGEAVGTVPSQLSLLENGKREPKITMLMKIAKALGTTLDDLLTAEPLDRRAALELELVRAQQGPLYTSLGLPTVKVGPRLGTDVIEALLGLQNELSRRLDESLATPEEARRANTELRAEMRECNNYYPDLEAEAAKLLTAVGHSGGPLSHHDAADLAEHLGFSIRFVSDLPHSTRSVTDEVNKVIYLEQSTRPEHDPRSVLLQALARHQLGYGEPEDYADFLRQRVNTNYFAGALLMPERAAVDFLADAKKRREMAIEDLRDAFAVSYESAAHRFTNLATSHLDITCHFQKVHSSGILHKGYENDNVNFPADHTGAIEGQTVCRHWTSREVFDVPDKFRAFEQYTDTGAGTFWCTAITERHSTGEYSLSIGLPFEHVRWFRGRGTKHRSTSTCPDPSCCRKPPESLAKVWGGHAFPAARANTHLLAAMPEGAFPGVDDTEVYQFLDRHAPAEGG